MNIINQGTELVPIESISASPENPNHGDIGAISESIQSSGFFGHVLVQQSTRRIIAGAHRHAAARALGAREIPVTFVDVDDERARRIMLADNRTARLGSDDTEKLAALLQELAATPAGLEGTGYDGDVLDELLADLGQMQPELAGDPDALPEAPEEPITQRGNVWLLGDHRIACGDSTDRADVERLMDGRRAALLLTDPPYAVDYVSKARDMNARGYVHSRATLRAAIHGDELEAGQEEHLWRDVLALTLDAALADDAALYIWHAPGRAMRLLYNLLDDLGVLHHQTIIWAKNNFVIGRCDYQWKHEPCFYGWKQGHRPPFYGEKNQTTLWDVARDPDPEHPAQKPVALFAPCFTNHLPPRGLGYDPFLGVGGALIAAEKTGRVLYGMEIDPRYVDVCVRRWESLSGKTARREPATASSEASDHARVKCRA